MKSFYVGGARSGKSTLATQKARELSNDVCCIVTALESDAEMKERIAAHRKDRPGSWRVIEEPRRLGSALQSVDGRHAVILIDCLTIWTANCLWPPESSATPDRALWHRERDAFLRALTACSSHVIIVSNEVGTGIIPANAASRVFVDEQGWLNQAVAAACDEVFQAVAGIPLCVKARQSRT
jgi:adenosylcobinamide kinase / adenosylcobinamide-phosphate guanylyltransferase